MLYWRTSQAVSNRALSEAHSETYAQETVKIDSACVECAMEVIYRVLDCTVLGDEVDQSVTCTCYVFFRVDVGAYDTY